MERNERRNRCDGMPSKFDLWVCMIRMQRLNSLRIVFERVLKEWKNDESKRETNEPRESVRDHRDVRIYLHSTTSDPFVCVVQHMSCSCVAKDSSHTPTRIYTIWLERIKNLTFKTKITERLLQYLYTGGQVRFEDGFRLKFLDHRDAFLAVSWLQLG